MKSPISAKASISRIAPVDLAGGEAENGAVQIDVVAAAEFRIEAGAQFEQRRNAPVHGHLAAGGLQNSGHELQQRALARSVFADDAEGLALLDLEADVLQRPEVLVMIAPGQQFLETVAGRVVDGVGFGDRIELDCRGQRVELSV